VIDLIDRESKGHPMRRSLRSLTASAAALALALAALTTAGCAKKFNVDQLGDLLVSEPEGVRGTDENTPSDLVVWPDAPNVITHIAVGATHSDTTFPAIYRNGPGTVQGMVLDYVGADGYQLFRSQGMRDSAGTAVHGGFRRFDDFMLSPYRRWPDRDYYAGAGGTLALSPAQAFAFADPFPATDTLKLYVGRAVIAGLSSRHHPITNRGQTTTLVDTIPDLVYTGSVTPSDSLIDMSWQPVAGAAGYWVHIHNIFQRRKEAVRSGDDAVMIGLPSPIARGGDRVMVRDLFIGYFPAPVTSYKLGNVLPPGSRVLVYRVLPALSSVRVRVSAVDANGRMIATIGHSGDRDDFLEADGSLKRVFTIGAKIVTPGRGTPAARSRFAPGPRGSNRSAGGLTSRH